MAEKGRPRLKRGLAMAVGLGAGVTTMLFLAASDDHDARCPPLAQRASEEGSRSTDGVSGPVDTVARGHSVSERGRTDRTARPSGLEAGPVGEAGLDESALGAFTALLADFDAAHAEQDWAACNELAYRMNEMARAHPAVRRSVVERLGQPVAFGRAQALFLSLRATGDPAVEEFLLSFLEDYPQRHGAGVDLNIEAEMLDLAALRSLLLIPGRDPADDAHFPSYWTEDGLSKTRRTCTPYGSRRAVPSRSILDRLDHLVDHPGTPSRWVVNAFLAWRDAEAVEKLLERVRGDRPASLGLRAGILAGWKSTYHPTPEQLAGLYRREYPPFLRRGFVRALRNSVREWSLQARLDRRPEEVQRYLAWAEAIAAQEPDPELARQLRSINVTGAPFQIVIDGEVYSGEEALEAARRLREERESRDDKGSRADKGN